MTTLKKWRGLKALVQDSVDGVSHAVERVQKETTKRWFDVAERIEPVAKPTRVVRAVHDTSVTGVHEIIRFTNRVVGAVADGVIDALEKIEAKKAAQADETTAADGPASQAAVAPAADSAGEPPHDASDGSPPEPSAPPDGQG
jgi:hypothetical protein